MTSQVPDTLIFKALVAEIHEVEPYFSPLDILFLMCDESRMLADYCEQFYFYADDGELTEDEAFLIEWLRTMEKDPSVLHGKLIATAHKLQANMRR